MNYSQIITKISAPFDPQMKQFNEDLALSSTFNYKDHGKFVSYPKLIIPSVNFKNYPLATLIPAALQVRFAAFSALYNPLKSWVPLKFEVFQNISEI